MGEVIGEGQMQLPFHLGILGHVAGIPVRETDLLAYDEMYLDSIGSTVVVGETAHFRWRLHQLALNDACRKAARAHIAAEARKILGEPWKVGGVV